MNSINYGFIPFRFTSSTALVLCNLALCHSLLEHLRNRAIFNVISDTWAFQNVGCEKALLLPKSGTHTHHRQEHSLLIVSFCMWVFSACVFSVSTYLHQFIEVSVLACSVFILAQDVLHCLCAQQQLHLVLLVEQRCVILLRKTADVRQPGWSRVGTLTQQVEGQCHVAHGL